MGRRKARSRLIPNPVPSRQFVLDLVLYDRLFRSLRERQVKRGFLLFFFFFFSFFLFFFLSFLFVPSRLSFESQARRMLESWNLRRDVSPCKATRRHRETLPSAATIINHSSFTRNDVTTVKQWLLQTNVE